MDFPIKNGDFPLQNVSLPEGNPHSEHAHVRLQLMNIHQQRQAFSGHFFQAARHTMKQVAILGTRDADKPIAQCQAVNWG